LRFLELGVRSFGVGREDDARAIDTIQEMKADVAVAGYVERRFEQSARFTALAAHEAQLGAPLQ
jgi:hypothetical protein